VLNHKATNGGNLSVSQNQAPNLSLGVQVMVQKVLNQESCYCGLPSKPAYSWFCYLIQ